MDSVLDDLEAAVSAGRVPPPEQLRGLLDSNDLVRIGMLADQLRRRRHGAAATFVRVAHVTLAEAQTATWPAGAREVCLVGAPESAEEAVEAAGALAARAGVVPVSAWSLADLERLAASESALTALVQRLSAAGVSAIAEARVDALASPVRSVAAVANAGSTLARVGVDRLASRDDALAVLQLVKRVQKATGAIRSFAPLPRASDGREPSTGYDDVKLVALARLYLDTVPSVQVDWQRCGPKLAQVALLFGADDIDGVSPVDEIDLGRRRAPLEEVRRNITAASLSPVERDGRWGIVGA